MIRSVRCIRPVARAFVALMLALATRGAVAQVEERGNFFDDPFEQVTSGIAACATPEGPMVTRAEMRAQSHWRVERGTSCYLSGRCRLPNAYLYDKEIVPRAKIAILADGRFANTSVWVEGQHRAVWLKGCVETPAQALALEVLVRDIDDVESVIDELVVMPAAKYGPVSPHQRETP